MGTAETEESAEEQHLEIDPLAESASPEAPVVETTREPEPRERFGNEVFPLSCIPLQFVFQRSLKVSYVFQWHHYLQLQHVDAPRFDRPYLGLLKFDLSNGYLLNDALVLVGASQTERVQLLPVVVIFTQQ